MNNINWSDPSTYIKALGGAAATAVAALLAKHHVLVDQDALTAVLSALIGFVVVLVTPKNKPTL